MHYAYDTVALAKGAGNAVVKAGRQDLVLPDRRLRLRPLAGGRRRRRWSKANGGTVVGSVRHPLNASDFSSFLLQAQAPRPQILGLANAGGDTINAIKAAKEFGINKTMKIAGLLVFINDIHSLGLKQHRRPAADRQLVLGPERRDAQVRQALLRQEQAHALQPPGRRLLRHA